MQPKRREEQYSKDKGAGSECQPLRRSLCDPKHLEVAAGEVLEHQFHGSSKIKISGLSMSAAMSRILCRMPLE